MNTDRLIDMLSAELEAVNSGRLGRALILAIVTGGAIAFGLMLVTVGPRRDLQSTAPIEWVAVKLLFALSVIVTGALLLNRSMRPGLEDATNWGRIFLPFLAALAVALAVLLGQPQAWRELLRGATTVSPLRCLLFIMFFAAMPLAAVIYALRQGAPTRLELCGGIAGIVAGGIGAAAYAFNCTSDTIPFIAIWYGAAIVICAGIGAQLGSRVLRW
jgi:hypothetical protein